MAEVTAPGRNSRNTEPSAPSASPSKRTKGAKMSTILKGVVAGFTATVVLSALMVMKQAMGLMPELDIAQMLTAMLGLPSIAVGWMMHFVIGTVVWGGLFAIIAPRFHLGNVAGGIAFGVAAWLMMMVAIMPMAGAGLFGLQMGILAPIMTFMLHVVFGAVLGWVFAALTSSDARRAASARG